MNPKFRAWDKKNSQMLSVTSITWEAKWDPNILSYVEGRNLAREHFCLKFEDVELMQWTGLKDKESQEIFEGDLIQSERNGGKPHRVDFILGSFVGNYGLKYDLGLENERVEVIGNVFENKELLYLEEAQ